VIKLLRPVLKALLILAILSYCFGSAQPAARVRNLPAAQRSVKSHAPTPAFSCDQPVRIMPLGDSITRGSSSGTPNDPQYYISYRRDLYQGCQIKAIRSTLSEVREVMGLLHRFRPGHEGWPGKRDEYIAQNIYTWLTNNPLKLSCCISGQMTCRQQTQIPAPQTWSNSEEIDRFDPEIGCSWPELSNGRLMIRIRLLTTTMLNSMLGCSH